MGLSNRMGWPHYLLFLAVFILFPFSLFQYTKYILFLVNMTAIGVIGALGLNILTGYTGLISLGQAAFMGVGAYTVAILGTKADNVEGDDSINASIARLALEYQIPLWNFWLAVQPLPNQGMADPDHLNSVSYANFTNFSIPNSLEYGTQMHNLTALQMLDFLRIQLAETP